MSSVLDKLAEKNRRDILERRSENLKPSSQSTPNKGKGGTAPGGTNTTQEDEEKKSSFWQGLLDSVAVMGKSGDSTLPLNNATVAIHGIRDNPEQVQELLDNSEEVEAEKRKKAAATQQWADEHPVLASAASVVTSPLSSVDMLQQLVEMNAVGKSLPHDEQLPGELTQTLRAGASEDMGKVGKFLYNTAMSGIDSYAAAMMGGGVPGVGAMTLAGGAASSTMNDIKNRGGSDEQAVIGGIAAGVFEGLFEQFSIGQLDAMKEMPADSAKTLLKNLVKSTVTNASEEAATETANILFDTVFMGDLSNYALMVEYAMSQGMTEEDAKRYVKNQLLGQIGESALSGAIMGTGMTAAASVQNAAVRAAQQKPTEPTTVDNTAPSGTSAQPKVESVPAPVAVDAAPVNTEVTAEAVEQLDAEQATDLPQNLSTSTEVKNNDGETVHLRDGVQRVAGADPGGQVSAVEAGTGRAESGKTESRPADSGAASFTYGAKVSAKGFGIDGGTDTRNLRVVTGGDSEATRAARQLAEQRGLKLVLFAGDNLTLTDKNGATYQARAYVEGLSAKGQLLGRQKPVSANVYVRADHPQFTAEQLTRHEIGHDMIARKEIDPATVRSRVEETFGVERVGQLAQAYAEVYEGSGMTPAEIWNEVICDSLGNMNIFDGKAHVDTTAQIAAETETPVESSNAVPTQELAEESAGEASRETPVPDNLTDEQRADLSATREAVRSTVREELDRLGKEYGWIKAGENPARSVELPQRTSDDKKVSQTVRTVMEAAATPDEALPTIESMVADGDFSREVYGDETAINDANEYISNHGWGDAQREWFKAMEKGEVSKRNTTVGWTLYNHAVNSGDTEAAIDILNAMVEHQRNAAQALQATRILKKLSPATQLYAVQKSVGRLQQELNDRYGSKKKGAPKITIDPELTEQLLSAPDQEGRDEAMKELYRSVGRQMPSRFVDKWSAWRYLAMLGNARTHVRNIFGNLVFAPVVTAKNLTATAIESAVNRVSGGRTGRSKSLVTGLTKNDRALLSAAWGDYTSVEDVVSGDSKYSDRANANQHIEEGRAIFGRVEQAKTAVGRAVSGTFGRGFETLRKANSKALDTEDKWFSKPHYAAALASYCKANGITAEQVQKGEGLDEARAYAIKEAQKATYRDTNDFSTAISQLGRYEGKNPFKKGISVAMEGVLPFRKTPANILARGLEYSPAGLVKSISYDLYKVKQGKMTATEMIDDLSAGLTGSGLLALGVFLAAEGIIRGHGGSDEDEKKFEELMGHKAYSLEVGYTSITLDWLAPEVIPFMVGVNLWELAENGTEAATLADVFSAIGMATEPLLEMSCLQSVNDVLDAVSYAEANGMDRLPAAIASAVTSYLTSAVPTLLGQIERIGQNVRMENFTQKNAFLTKDMQYALGNVSGKVPGVDYNQVDYIDAWGRSEDTGTVVERMFNNMLNPAYVSEIEMSPMEEELLRLYEQTSDAGVFPSRAANYFKVSGKRVDLSASQYVSYAKVKGQTAYDILTELTAGESYKSMTDEEKAEAVELVYEYADALAKAKVSSYALTDWIAKAHTTTKGTGISEANYVTLYIAQNGVKSLKDADGDTITNSKGLQIMELVYNTPGLTEKQQQALFKDFDVGKTVIDYDRDTVAETLAEMRSRAK